MKTFQHTILNKRTISGVGLHTGKVSILTFLPAKINFGIKFQRIDLKNKPIIKADVDNVIEVERGTTISENNGKVSTIEHLLAALIGLQIDNILIQIDGPEVPIMDGSSIEFVKCLEKCKIREQDAARKYLEIPKSISYKDKKNNVEISAYPFDDYRVTVMVDYNSQVLGSQHHTLNKIDNFKKDIAKSRTFCFLHEVEELFKQDLIKGGDLNNAIVIVDKVLNNNKLQEISKMIGKKDIKIKKEGILNNTKLRYNNEPARHKLLDVIGDLALVGKPIKGHIIGARPGHKSNIEFAKILKSLSSNNKLIAPKYNINKKSIYNINQ